MKISVVVPCYNEQESIWIFYQEMDLVSKKMDYNFEFICVNDGSKDDTLSIIKDVSMEDSRVKYVSFSRNFGKESAILAGFSEATGDYIVMMDADLQDPPRLLPLMMQYIEEGYDSVATRRVTRKGEPPIRSFFARMFYKLMNKFSDVDVVDGARDYRLMTAQMKDAILSMTEYNRFSKGIFGWVGFKTKWIEYENVERVAGETKWNFWKLFIYALDGIMAFSTAPLTFSVLLGVLFCMISVGLFAFVIVDLLFLSLSITGWIGMASVMFLFGGIMLICIGIMGQYLGKAYLEVKNRPKYIIKEKTT